MKFDKDIKQCKIWLGVVCFFIFFEGVNFGYNIYHYMATGKGVVQMILASIGAVICTVCVFVMCRVIARYHVMNCEAREIENRIEACKNRIDWTLNRNDGVINGLDQSN